MNTLIEILSCKIGEGLQASRLTNTEQPVNVFQRVVQRRETSGLSFVLGLSSAGLRASAFLEGDQLIRHLAQLKTTARQHLPLVVHTTAPDGYSHIHAIQQAGCFIWIARSAEEEVQLTLIAHRIAELSLIPGIIIADHLEEGSPSDLPSDALIRKFLGSPDDLIESPTPAQKIIFGNKRRRVPNWYSLDLPVMLGAKKSGKAASFEAAAGQKYFYEHLPAIIDQVFKEFTELFGDAPKPVTTAGKSSYALVTKSTSVRDRYDDIASKKKGADLVLINQLLPFPEREFEIMLKGRKAVTVLEQASVPGWDTSPLYERVIHAVKNDRPVYSGRFSNDFASGSLVKAIQYMVSGQPVKQYFIGLEFTRSASEYPGHEILLQEIEKQYPGISEETIHTQEDDRPAAPTDAGEIPLAVRMYADKGPRYTRLSRFYNDTAFFYRHNINNELTADPFNALPAIPGMSASLLSSSHHREKLPSLDVSLCTGCGDCFVQCPHSALPPIAVSVEQLMRTGAAIASSKSKPVSLLTPMFKNLGLVSSKIIIEDPPPTAGEFLPAAFERLTEQMKLEGHKLNEALSEFNGVLEEISSLPTAVTDHFYLRPERAVKGSGELFSLAVDPNACTGCGICAEACEPSALSMEEENGESIAAASAQFKLWEQLPDISADTVSRLHSEKQYDSLAAILLSRNYYLSMAGSAHSDDDLSYKTMLHIILASAEAVIQPAVVRQLKKIGELTEELSENVHHKLSDALPKENLESLSKSLHTAQGKKTALPEIVKHFTSQQSTLIDTADLERKTNLIESLKNLGWALEEGPSGLGRSRFGILMAGGSALEWAGQYPANHFSSPVVIHMNGSAPERVLGMFYGQLRYLLDNIKLIRRAELESKDKYDPSVHDKKIARLQWEDLTDEEKQLIPPILLIAEREDLDGAGWNSLNKILAERFPVKVFLMDHMTSPENSPAADLAQTNSGILSTIGLKNAFVFQGGMGNTNHLADGLMGGLSKTYPALFNLYASRTDKHQRIMKDASPLAALALNSRAIPALRYDPGEKSDYLSGAISLAGNKRKEEDWVVEEIEISEKETIKYAVSWADWAFEQSAWKDHFKTRDHNPAYLPVTEYIELSAQARKNHHPVIMRADQHGLKYFMVSKQVVEMTETVLAHWKTIREVAGLLTEFPLKLRTEIIKELSAKYEAEAASLKEEYERRLKELEASQGEVLRTQLKEKLIALASMARKKNLK